MSQRQFVLDQLAKFLGGKKKSALSFAEKHDADLINPWSTGEETVYLKNYNMVRNELFAQIYGKAPDADSITDLKKLEMIPEALITREIDRKKKLFDIDVSEKKKKFSKAQRVYNKAIGKKKEQKLYDIVKGLSNKTDAELDKIEKEAELPKSVLDLLDKIKEEKPKGRTYTISDDIKIASGRRKRKPSAFNIKVKKYMKAHRNATLPQAARAVSGKGAYSAGKKRKHKY